MSSKIIDDVKTGVKGIRGAGDALRGNLMQATDQAFDNSSNQNHHTHTQAASEVKNESIAEKGKRDIQAADDMIARREQEREARKMDQAAAVAAAGQTHNGAGAQRGAGHHPLPMQ
ncbi:hypothetical protein F4777DRAFT_576702 [Nemania sp. FL0916]|nr:hypothetical protein F4777DRAFT_576702 [Nemania sp. FL0916]